MRHEIVNESPYDDDKENPKHPSHSIGNSIIHIKILLSTEKFIILFIPMLKPIPDFPDYFASEEGEIYSMKPITGKHRRPPFPRKMKLDKDYYFMVILRKGGKSYRKTVHSLVLSAFISPRPKGMECCHGSEGRYCNSLNNLRWGTPQENCAERIACHGEKHPSHKLNELQVRIIKRAYSYRGIGGLDYRQLAEIFGVKKITIKDIIGGETWKHLSTA